MSISSALIIIDVQNDFCEGGSLAVPNGSDVVGAINQLMPQFETVVLSQDWHPPAHSSFASSHTGRSPYEVIEMPYGPQVLWPDHCIQGSAGAQFHPNLETNTAQMVVRKGFRRQIDSYSAFFENDQSTPTGLEGYLKTRGISAVTLVGLALDFCVQYTALDARKLGFDVAVIQSACRAIDLEGSLASALNAMLDAGVKLK